PAFSPHSRQRSKNASAIASEFDWAGTAAPAAAMAAASALLDIADLTIAAMMAFLLCCAPAHDTAGGEFPADYACRFYPAPVILATILLVTTRRKSKGLQRRCKLQMTVVAYR